MLTFNGSNLPGWLLWFGKQPPEIRAMRTSFFGVSGESEIFGQAGGRYIEMIAIVTDDSFSTSDDLVNYLRGVESQIGQHGTLERSNPINETFNNCTFEGFEILERGMLRDDAGTLSLNGVSAWHATCRFRFYQLLVD